MKITTLKRGRPRKFDRDQVLDCAICTFWTNGFDGASMADLTQSMGINSPSLYSTFGNKHELFMEAIDRYSATIGRRRAQAFNNEPDIKLAVAAYLKEVATGVTSKDNPAGCLIANVAIELANRDVKVRDKIADMMAKAEDHFAGRLQSAQEEGQLTRQTDPQALARMILLVTQGLASRARVGASRDEVSALVKNFVAVLFPV